VGLVEREVEEEEKGWRVEEEEEEEEEELRLLGKDEVELLKLREEEEGEREVVGRREERSEEDRARRGPLVGWERSIWKICQREEEEEEEWVSETMSSSSVTEERREVDPFPNPTTRRRPRTSHPPRWIETVPSRSSRSTDQGEEDRPGGPFVGLTDSSSKISSGSSNSDLPLPPACRLDSLLRWTP